MFEKEKKYTSLHLGTTSFFKGDLYLWTEGIKTLLTKKN